MKNTLISALIFASLSLASCTVGIPEGPPNAVVEIVPVAPSPRHIWVGGYYGYRENRYIWNPGSYQLPPRGRTGWTQGVYRQNNRGNHVFVRGHWY